MSHGKKRKRDESTKQDGKPLCSERKSDVVTVLDEVMTTKSTILCGRLLSNGKTCRASVQDAQPDLLTEAVFCPLCRGDLGVRISSNGAGPYSGGAGPSGPHSFSRADIVYRVLDKDGCDVPLDDDTELVFADDDEDDTIMHRNKDAKSAASAVSELTQRLQLPPSVTEAAQNMWRDVREKMDRIVDPLAVRALIVKLCSYRLGCPVPLDRLYDMTGVDASALVQQRSKLHALGIDVSFDRSMVGSAPHYPPHFYILQVVNGLIQHYVDGWVRAEIAKNVQEPGPFSDSEIRKHASDILLPQSKKLVAAYFADEKSRQQKNQCSTLAASMLLVRGLRAPATPFSLFFVLGRHCRR
jgi:hypothetical protein